MPTLGPDLPISLRLPEAVVAEADALIAVVNEDAVYRALLGGAPTRAAVLRLAIVKGLRALREEHDAKQRK